MHLWGYIANTATVLAGSSLGFLAGSRLPEPIKKIILTGLGLSTILIGARMSFETKKLLLVVGSIVVGGIIGQLIGIEEWLEHVGERLRRRFESGKTLPGSAESTFVLGFVTASLLFCTGPMTIVGSLEDGFARSADLIYIKSLMDGVAAVALTASLGIGVFFSAATVFIFQGLLTYAGMAMGSFIGEPVMAEISATGGALILGIGFNLLGFGRIKVGNFLPALFMAGILAWWLL
ncbi:MAG: hypothetical protein A2W25_07940 [candidate division Zixibacteria bacterium RBG_16_53_22]|nr:MAG: hypothetical protein A2W25_07940 [candidate division Zixibacteria bacterium RBG_16_53_22]